MSSSVKMAQHVIGLSWPYSVFTGRGVRLFCVFVWLTAMAWFKWLEWFGVVGGLAEPVPAVAESLVNDHTMHVQSREPVTRYEPQLSSATHVMMSKCLVMDATVLPRCTLITFSELSQQPAAYKWRPSMLTANICECKLTAGWKGPLIRLRFLEESGNQGS